MRIPTGGLCVVAGEGEWSWRGRNADDGGGDLDGETIEDFEVFGGEIGAVVAIGVDGGSAAGHALLWLCVHISGWWCWGWDVEDGGGEGGSGLMRLGGARGA